MTNCGSDGLKRPCLPAWSVMSVLLMFAAVLSLAAQTNKPKVSPKACYTDADGVFQQVESIDDGEAPLDITFKANPENMEGHTPAYEWHFVKMARGDEPQRQLMVRYEEDTQYTFNESGTYNITLKTTLTDSEVELDSVTLVVVVSESKLEFPNAFSPNDDGINDVFKAKDGWKSIVRFDAWIISRWGQRLFHWTDPAEGWDGTYNGKPVKDGVYFVRVKALGADGREYDIRRDVNLLRGLLESGTLTQ